MVCSQGKREKEEDVINQYVQPQLLVLDEVLAEHSINGELSKHEKQLLFEIINQRYEKMHCTIIVSNANRVMLTRDLGFSTVDRLTENSIELDFQWDSYRKHQFLSVTGEKE